MQQIISRKEAKEKGLTRYFTGKPCKHGHVSEKFVNGSKCCACNAEKNRKFAEQNKEKIADRNRKYREKNKDKLAEKDRKRYEQNKKEISKRMRKYYEQKREIFSERGRKYREENNEKISEYREQNKEKIAEQRREYRIANPEQQFIRNSLNRCMDNFAGKRAKAEKLVGYTYEQLREHIESRFEDGMSWENRSEWHIDHKKPISAFLKEGITDPTIINALDNLQPLWAHENLSKHAKWDAKTKQEAINEMEKLTHE